MQPRNLHGTQKLVVCRCFSFSKGGIFRFHVSFTGVYQSNFFPETLLGVFFSFFGATSPKRALQRWFSSFLLVKFCYSWQFLKKLQTIVETYIRNAFVHYGLHFKREKSGPHAPGILVNQVQ